MQAPKQAAEELRHAVRVLGLRGAQIGSNVAGKNLDDPELEPVWATAAELDAFILLHPINVAGGGSACSPFFLQSDRQPARHHHRGRMSRVQRRARAPFLAEDLPRPWRRIRSLSSRAFRARLARARRAEKQA